MTEYVPLNGEVDAVTDKAIHFVYNPDDDDPYGQQEKWIPRSVCEDGENVAVGDEELRIARWFVEKEGMD